MYKNDRERMIIMQLKSRDIHDLRILKAMSTVLRELFVSEDQSNLAYEDYPLPISYGQTISQPYIVAYMTEALQLKASDKILEIDTGSGYQAAILAEICQELHRLGDY